MERPNNSQPKNLKQNKLSNLDDADGFRILVNMNNLETGVINDFQRIGTSISNRTEPEIHKRRFVRKIVR